MNRKFLRFLAVPLVFPLIFSSFFCCCLTHSVHAAGTNDQPPFAVAAEDHPRGSHCDSYDPVERSSTSRHECECPKLQGTLAKSLDVASAADAALYSFDRQIGSSPIFPAIVLDSRKLLTEHSPPRFSSSATPLYIKNSVLRI